MTRISLTQFLLEDQRQRNKPDSEFVLLLNDVATSCKQIASAINKGALADTMGNLTSQNVQGETQKQLDVISNDIFIQTNQRHANYTNQKHKAHPVEKRNFINTICISFCKIELL